jgi:hypothetical protein
MAETGIDWVGLAGILGTILGTLGGVIVGAFGAWKIQQQQLKHADDTRFQQQRLKAYTDYISSITISLGALKIGEWDKDNMDLFLETYDIVKMIGSHKTVEVAEEVHTAFIPVFVPKQADRQRIANEITQDPSTGLLSHMNRFREEARRELRVAPSKK